MSVCLRAFAAGGGASQLQFVESDITVVCRYIGCVRYNGVMPLYRDAFVPSEFGTAISGTPLFRMPPYRATQCMSKLQSILVVFQNVSI